MDSKEDTRRYKYHGTELAVFFWMVAALFLLVAVFGFKSSVWLSMFFLLLLILLVLFIRWDSAYHLVIVTPEKLVFEKVVWRRLSTSFIYVPWGDVEKVITAPYGPFGLLKQTQIESKGHLTIRVYSFLEDYLHFLKDLTRYVESPAVDKLTTDLLTGRADV